MAAFTFLFLTGSVSCGPFLEQRTLLKLEFTGQDNERIFETNELVDELTSGLIAFFVARGFESIRQSKSFGLQPWTGHTQDVWLQLAENDGVWLYVSVAKCCISAEFSELETAIDSAVFSARPSDKERIREAEIALISFLKSEVASENLGLSKEVSDLDFLR